MQQFQDLLRKENPLVSILSINMDMPEYRFLAEKNWKKIYDYIVKTIIKDVTNYVFIDEVQNVPEFEKLLITMDYETGTFNGIKKINALDWLINI